MPLDQIHLRSLLRYDPESGAFTWLPRENRQWTARWAGAVAGNIGKLGYVSIQINGKRYKAHRLAWLYMTGEWPSVEIDHRDLDKANNAWLNLRQATGSQNKANKSAPSTNTSGFKGVCPRKTRGIRKWRASIMVDGRRLELGHFLTREEAATAYAARATEFFGEFARCQPISKAQ